MIVSSQRGFLELMTLLEGVNTFELQVMEAPPVTLVPVLA